MSNDNSKIYKIQTERLVIRCYNPTDASMLKQSIDQSLEHLLPWMPWAISEPESIETKIERLRTFRGMFDLGQDFVYGIFDKEETKLIGSTGLHTRVGKNAREIGYWIHSNEINKGYATETVMALIKIAFEKEQIERIEIRCDPANERSFKIPKKLNFIYEATLKQRTNRSDGAKRDVMIWSMFKENYDDAQIKNIDIKIFDAAGKILNFE